MNKIIKETKYFIEAVENNEVVGRLGIDNNPILNEDLDKKTMEENIFDSVEQIITLLGNDIYQEMVRGIHPYYKLKYINEDVEKIIEGLKQIRKADYLENKELNNFAGIEGAKVNLFYWKIPKEEFMIVFRFGETKDGNATMAQHASHKSIIPWIEDRVRRLFNFDDPYKKD